jgi:hypothetical protein
MAKIIDVNGKFYISKSSDLGTMYLSNTYTKAWTNKLLSAASFPTQEYAEQILSDISK